MTHIITTGKIADFSFHFNHILEKYVKAGNYTISENKDKKQLIISISCTNTNGITIYNVIRDGVLFVYVFYKSKKTIGQNQNLNLTPSPQETYKELVINYKEAVSYHVVIACYGAIGISKSLKKNKLEVISKLDGSRTLYKFMNKYLFAIDTTGVLFYYPDSIDIKPLNVSLSNNLMPLECNLEATAYGLCDGGASSNVAIESSPGTLEQSKPEQNAPSGDASYSTLGYILSWLNPLAYYNNSSNSSNLKTQNSQQAETEDTKAKNANTNPNNARYLLDTSSADYDIIKIQDQQDLQDNQNMHNNQVKILKAIKIEIPLFITDITIDNVDNILFIGSIDNVPTALKCNKYMIGMHLI